MGREKVDVINRSQSLRDFGFRRRHCDFLGEGDVGEGSISGNLVLAKGWGEGLS